MNVSAISAKVVRPVRAMGRLFAIGFGTGLLLSCGVKPTTTEQDTFQKENPQVEVRALDTEKEAETNKPLIGDLIFGSALLASVAYGLKGLKKPENE